MSVFARINELTSSQEKSNAVKQVIKENKVSKAELIAFLNHEIKTTNSKTWLDQSNKILKWVHLNYSDPVIKTIEEPSTPTPIYTPKTDLSPSADSNASETVKPIVKSVKKTEPTQIKSIIIGFFIGLLFGLASFAVYFFIFVGFDTNKSFHDLESIYKESSRYDLLVEISKMKENISDLKVQISEFNSKDKSEFQKLLEIAEEADQKNKILEFTKIITKINLFENKYPNSKYLPRILDRRLELQKAGASLAVQQLIRDYNESKSKLSISDISRLAKDIQFNQLYFETQLTSAEYKDIIKIIQTKSVKSKKYEKYENEIIQLISQKKFSDAKNKLAQLQKKNPNDSYSHLSEEILQSELGSKILFLDNCVSKAKKLRRDDEDDGNPYYQIQLMVTLNHGGKHSVVEELWTEFNKADNYTFLMNYPSQFFETVVKPMSQLNKKDKLNQILLQSEKAIQKMPLDSNGTKVLASIQLIQAYNYLKNDSKVDSLLDQLIIKTEFFNVNTLQDLSLNILKTLKNLAKYHGIQVQKILAKMDRFSYPTQIATVLMQLGKFQEAFDMIDKYKQILLPQLAIEFAKQSQDNFALQCIEFIVKTEDVQSAEVQKLLFKVSNALSKNGKFEASLKVRAKLVIEAYEWKISYFALKILNQQKYAVHKFEHGDRIRAKSILKDNRSEINKIYAEPKYIRSRTISVFNLAQSYYRIGEFDLAYELVNATLLLLENVPATSDNLKSLSRVLFFEICSLYSKLLQEVQSGMIQINGVNETIILSRLKNTIVKMNRTYSSYNSDFIDSTLDIHKMAMYNLKVGLKVKFEEYMALLETIGDDRKLSVASNYWLKTAQTYLLNF